MRIRIASSSFYQKEPDPIYLCNKLIKYISPQHRQGIDRSGLMYTLHVCKGMCEKERLTAIQSSFVTMEKGSPGVSNKIGPLAHGESKLAWLFT